MDSIDIDILFTEGKYNNSMENKYKSLANRIYWMAVLCMTLLAGTEIRQSMANINSYKVPVYIPLSVKVVNIPEYLPEYYTIKMDVSAYCAGECCCDQYADGITASGKPAEGFLVAAPPCYPFGVRMRIEGYAGGQSVYVEDRGGAIRGNKLDLLFSTHKEALEWGRRTVEVKIYF